MQPTEKYQVPRADIPQVSAPIRLGGHPSRSTKLKGFSAVIYGASFVIVGLFAARFTVVRYLSGEANTVGDVRLAFLLLFASTFLLGGIFFCTHGLRDVLGEARKKRLSLEQPNKPWLGDYAWRQEGFKFSASREASKPLLTALIGSVFVAPFAWVALGNPFAWAFDMFVVLLSVLPAAAWWRYLAILRGTLRFGNSFLKYETFPFFVGGTLKAHLWVQRNLESLQTLTVTLRCVREKYVTTGGSTRWGGSRGVTSTECYELFEKVVALDQAQMTESNGDGIPLQLPIPADAPSTELSNHPPTYWEIEAIGQANGPSYKAVFMVPVYRA